MNQIEDPTVLRVMTKWALEEQLFLRDHRTDLERINLQLQLKVINDTRWMQLIVEVWARWNRMP